MALSEECADRSKLFRKDKIMVRDIISLIFMTLIFCSTIVFVDFVISKLKKIDAKTNNIPKRHWSMRIYMDDIPQNEQNTLYLGSVPLKMYEKGEYVNLPVPRVGDEVGGVYCSGEDRFDMNGIVTSVYYNTSMDLIVVECRCTNFHKRPKNLI